MCYLHNMFLFTLLRENRLSIYRNTHSPLVYDGPATLHAMGLTYPNRNLRSLCTGQNKSQQCITSYMKYNKLTIPIHST